jgi:hypothetical protein
MIPKFNIGELVIADNEEATITEILLPADSDFNGEYGYSVEWASGEWGTYMERELLAEIENIRLQSREAMSSRGEYKPINGRIKALLEQSGLQAYYDAQDGQIEKFAKLIIDECADVCLAQRDPPNLNYKPSKHFAKQIHSHFGINT